MCNQGNKNSQAQNSKEHVERFFFGEFEEKQYQKQNKKRYPSGDIGDRGPKYIVFLYAQTIEINKSVPIPFEQLFQHRNLFLVEVSFDGAGNFVHVLFYIIDFFTDIFGKVRIHIGTLLDFTFNIVRGVLELTHSFTQPSGYSRNLIRTEHHHHYK
tara:strand:+ start:13547 stop:14014 length:468 start_codon:yes stop_codon:yes gene_type:complete